jgi:hypothetical protein
VGSSFGDAVIRDQKKVQRVLASGPLELGRRTTCTLSATCAAMEKKQITTVCEFQKGAAILSANKNFFGSTD